MELRDGRVIGRVEVKCSQTALETPCSVDIALDTSPKVLLSY